MEKILEHRIIKRASRKQIQLKVKWKGYTETTWEKFLVFARDSPELV